MLILNNSKLEVYVRSDRSLFRRAEVDPVAQLADFSLAFFFFLPDLFTERQTWIS